MEFIPSEKATPIRYPSTANLNIDSADRPNPTSTSAGRSAFDFLISRPNALMNGYFTRIGTTEVVLEWCEPNIVTNYNDTIDVDISGSGANTFNDSLPIVLSQGFYTIEDALNAIIDQLNLYQNDGQINTGCFFTLVPEEGGAYSIDCSGGVWATPSGTQSTNLAAQLEAVFANLAKKHVLGQCPDIRPFRYIDFVSADLTYNQDLKDTTTATYSRDVLCRWYFSWDTPPEADGLGYPVLMGYRPFVARRLFNPPKQIKWSPNMPIGNLAFQVYGYDITNGVSSEPLTQFDANTNWLMTLQVSEI